MIIFKGDDKFAYRDPACIFYNGLFHLFFTLSEKDGEYMYNRIAHSKSRDLINWSEPDCITVRDRELNFCSPGNIIEYEGKFIMCFCSYPMPHSYNVMSCANESARLFTMETSDFESFSEPVLLNPKSGIPVADIGRMIDPYIIKKDGIFNIFFKQNGISFSTSHDLVNWHFGGHTDGGENTCAVEFQDGYLLIHSPENGVACMYSEDLKSWRDYSYTVLKQSEWDWASGRLTAGFAIPLPDSFNYRYALFFHASCNVYPETHGNATLALAFTNDFKSYECS